MRWFPEPVSATNNLVAAFAMAAVTLRMLFSTGPGGCGAELVEGGVPVGCMAVLAEVGGEAAKPSSEASCLPASRAQQQQLAVHLLYSPSLVVAEVVKELDCVRAAAVGGLCRPSGSSVTS